jgi:ATP-dependent exoDNAse (exonuclease V) alpha subunit
VAIFHLQVKLITRGAGRSATAAVAYRAADHVPDGRTGLVFDYTRKRGVEHTEIVLPGAMAETATWARDRVRLWNAAEAAENRKDAREAREYEVALPHELQPPERRELVRAFAREIAERHGCALDVAIHAPHREGDTRNHHAHILATTRRVTESGLGAKTDIELKDADRTKKGLGPGREELKAIRARWASLVNERLAEHGQAVRVDHRSLEAQGIDREATIHKGPAVTAIERREQRSFIAERMREDVTERLRIAAELGRLERESKELARSIIDTSTALQAAIATRDAQQVSSPNASAREPQPSMADIRRDAQTQWLALIAEQGRAERQTQSREAASTLDLTGNVAAAAASRTAAAQPTTREQAQVAWREHVIGRASDVSGHGRPASGKETPPDDDRAL